MHVSALITNKTHSGLIQPVQIEQAHPGSINLPFPPPKSVVPADLALQDVPKHLVTLRLISFEHETNKSKVMPPGNYKGEQRLEPEQPRMSAR